MINIENAKEEFMKYVSKFEFVDGHMKGKVSHSFRVMELSNRIARNLSLTEDGIELATLIGLLHDIARFEQYATYKTFRDVDSFDHGDYGAQILQKDGYIRKYIEIQDYDNIIIKAVKNHNKFEIDSELTTEEDLFTNIVRDADKLDIFYEMVEMFWKDRKKEVETSKISPEVEEQFLNRNTIERKKGHLLNQVDKLVSQIAFIYDMNFRISFNIVKENDYINRMIDQFNFEVEETKLKMENIRKIANQYVEINQ